MEQQTIYCIDNFGYHINICFNYIDIETLKKNICNKYLLIYNQKYYPENLKLFTVTQKEITNDSYTNNINHINIVIIPINCSIHSHCF